jgi:hypothetical protein
LPDLGVVIPVRPRGHHGDLAGALGGADNLDRPLHERLISFIAIQ